MIVLYIRFFLGGHRKGLHWNDNPETFRTESRRPYGPRSDTTKYRVGFISPSDVGRLPGYFFLLRLSLF